MGAALAITEASADDIVKCAEMMANSEPWRSFKYSAAECEPKITSAKWVKLAKRGSELLGFISYKPEGVGSMSCISLLCIAPEHRGRGIGGQLLKHAEEHIFSFDHNAMLFVTSFNTSAIKFYEERGYVRVGEVTDYNFTGQSEYLYRKTTGPRRQNRIS